ncbi:meiosis inhibitor protein 1-like isoform X1 [Clytia hemisphaerica]|uniref:meiosis inhibitor protein 1-like isoform X1 n=1 Tax=Clytia hemisphaerica TaxID=252671 RepID=UPI0034D54388
MFLSQHSAENIPYVTTKHNSHDSFWLLPGVSTSLFCFGCAIENLEDKSVLNYRKKHILTDLLEILLTNKTIWQLFASKNTIYRHVITILLNILIENSDKEMGELSSELCLLMTKRTSPEKTAPLIMDQLLIKSKSLPNPSFMTFLKTLITAVPSVVLSLCDNKALFVNELLQFISTCKNDMHQLSWSLLASILTAVVSEQIPLSQNVLKQILKTIVDSNSTSITTDIEIMKCLQPYLNIKSAQTLLLEHESSHFTTVSNSVLEFIKKMLLCSSEECKRIAISCLTDIARIDGIDSSNNQDAEFSSLLNFIIQKGITEYLLELLSSSQSAVLCQLFQCLEKLSHSKKFHSLGHMVYGFSAILKAVHSTDDRACCMQGLVLIDLILEGRSTEEVKTNVTESQIDELINLVKKCFTSSDDKIKSSAFRCLCTFLQSSKTISSANHEKILNLFELSFQYMEREISTSLNSQLKQYQIDLVSYTYKSVLILLHHISNKEITSSASSIDQQSQSEHTKTITDLLFFMCDKYFIPQAVLKFLPRRDLKFQEIFYQMILHIMELDVTKGEMLAKKMCESSFISLVYDFKVVAARLSNDPKLTSVLGKLLMYLCMAIDRSNVHQSFDENLLNNITHFNTPIQEWRQLLEDNDSTEDYKSSQRTVLLILLACSHMAGCILIPLPVLQPFLERTAMNPTLLFSFTTLGKRYFLYLCCQVDMCNTQQSSQSNSTYHKLIWQIFTDQKEHLELLFHNSNLFLAWLLRMNIPNKIFQSFIERHFASSDLDSSNLTTALDQSSTLFIFVERSIKQFSSFNNETVQTNLSCYLESLLSNNIGHERYGYLKHLIHKGLLFTEEFNHVVIAVFIKLLNTISTHSDSQISDEELKLFCRIIEYIREDAVPTLLIEALKYSYLILTRSIKLQDMKPISIAVKNNTIFSTFSKLFFNNEKVLQTSKTTLLLERLYSSIVLMTSQLMLCSHMFATKPPNPTVVNKTLLIELFSCTNLPILQLSLTKFWNYIFQLGDQNDMIRFLDSENNECNLSENDYQLLLIILENIVGHQEPLLGYGAVYCLLSMIKNLPVTRDYFFSSPWTQILYDTHCDSTSETTNALMVTLHHLSVYNKETSPLNNAQNALDSLANTTQIMEKPESQKLGAELVLVLLNYVREILDQYLHQMEYDHLKRFKGDLKNLDKFWKSRETQTSLEFIDIFGLFFSSDVRSIDVSSSIIEMRKLLEKRITEIDDDETESDDGD